MDNIQKQLIAKLGEEFTNIFPLQYVSNILDKATGETLTILLSRYNHIFIPFTGEKEVTRAAVPPIMRRKGLYITYITPNSEIITEYFKGNKTEVNNEDWVKDEYWGTNLTSDNFVPITLPDGSITADKLSQEVLDLIGQGFKGNIENHPDGEDLTSVELTSVGNTKYKVLKFADRNYTQDGMGYVILRKNKSFEEQVTKSNTIYEIRYNFDLGSSIVSIPEGCVLKFEGGSVSNGTISLANTYIEASSVVFKNVVLNGSIRNKCFEVLWAGAIPDNNLINTGQVLYNIESLNTVLLFKTGKYYIDEYFTIKEGLNIQGDSDNINNNTIFYPFRNGQNYIIKLGGNKDTYNDNVNRCRRPIIKGITFATNGELFTNNSATDYEFGLLVLNRVEIGNFAIAFRNLSNVIPLWIGYSYELTFDYISCYVNKVSSNIPVIYFGAVGLKDVSALNINSLECETITGPIISQRAGSSVSELYISEVNFESSVNFLGEGIHLINNDPDYYYHIRQVNSEDYEDFNSTIKIPLFNINNMYGYIGNITCNRIGMSKWINDLDGDGEYRTYGFISIKNNNIATPLVINNVTLLSSAYCYLEDLSANNYSGELTINNINFPNGRYVNSVLQPSSGYIIYNVNDKGVSNIKVVNHNCMTNYPKVIKELTIDSQNYNNLCFSSKINTTEGNLIKTFSKEKISRTHNLDINIFKSANKDLIFYSPTVALILSDYILIRDLSVLEIDGFINVNGNIIFYIDYYEYTYTEGIRNLVPTLVSTEAFNVAFTNSSLTRLTKLIKANSIIKVRRQIGYNFYVNSIRITEANKVFKGKINPISGSEGIIFYTEDGDLKIIEKNYKSYKIPIVSDKEIILYSAEQTLLSDKIYKVISDIELSGRTLTLPANCTLDFQGGSFKNGTIVGSNTKINAGLDKIFNTDITISGTWNVNEAYPEWFGAITGNFDSRLAIQLCLNSFNTTKLSSHTYTLNSYSDEIAETRTCLIVPNGHSLIGNKIYELAQTNYTLQIAEELNPVYMIRLESNSSIKNLYICGNSTSRNNGAICIGTNGFAKHLLLENVLVRWGAYGFSLKTFLSTVINCQVANSNIGFRIYGDTPTNNFGTSTTLIGCYGIGIINTCYQIESMIYSSIVDCACDSSGLNTDGTISGDYIYDIINSRNISINNCGIEICPLLMQFRQGCRNIDINGGIFTINATLDSNTLEYIKINVGEKDINFNNLRIWGTNGDPLGFIKVRNGDFSCGYQFNNCYFGNTTKLTLGSNLKLDNVNIVGNVKVYYNDIPNKGLTSTRPSLTNDNLYNGFMFFDLTLNKYICWNGTTWVNLDGTALA